MKKAKIMLSAIAILAVVGGAFAFKASRLEVVGFYGTTAVGQNTAKACTIPTTIITTNLGTASLYFSTRSTTINCPLTFSTAVE